MICPRPSGVVATDPSPMAPPARPAPISSLIADDGRDRDLVYRLRTIGLHYHALVNARFLCHHEASWQAATVSYSGARGIGGSVMKRMFAVSAIGIGVFASQPELAEPIYLACMLDRKSTRLISSY